MSAWTHEEDVLATTRWLEGKSASEIVGLLRGAGFEKRTRNAVIGRIHRMGLTGRMRPSVPKKTTFSPRIKAPRVARSHVRPPKPGPQKKPALVMGTTFIEGPDSDASREACRRDGLSHLQRVITGAGVESPDAKPLLETTGGCKWPLGERHETRLCCNPIARGVYCEGHAAVAYVDDPRRSSCGASKGAHSSVEKAALWLTRFDRIDHYAHNGKQRGGVPKTERSVWDEARAAA